MYCTCMTSSLQHAYGCPLWTDPLPLATENRELRHQHDLLGDALGKVLVRAGILNGATALTGPELLLAAEAYLELPTSDIDNRPTNVMGERTAHGLLMPSTYEDKRSPRAVALVEAAEELSVMVKSTIDPDEIKLLELAQRRILDLISRETP